ncbi:MAG: kynureninase [Stagnimonas sp.]|nr:kynureninase [Stagnimonas sp.]
MRADAGASLSGMTIATTRAACLALDAADPLAARRARFRLPEGLNYLDGNSLGVLPAATPARLSQVIAGEWGEGLIRSWNAAGWIEAPRRIGDQIGRLIGATPGQTLAADSTSINLHKLLAMALSLRPGRRVIVSEADNFPTDLYIAQGLIAQLDGQHELRLLPAGASAADYEAALGPEVAVLMLSHVNYRSGAMHDLRRLTAAAQAAGALTLWDLAHSAGAVPLALDEDGADLAVGCGYKYLNGGPGAPAFLYIAKRWQGQARSPLTGWFGHAQPFAFEPDYVPAPDIAQALCGTPPILSLSALEVGIEQFEGVDLVELRAKSVALCELFIALVESRLAGQGFVLASPREAARRGSQVCLRHPAAWPICQALIARGVIGDFRAPDILRFGFAPLYVRYLDVWEAVSELEQVMRSGEWRQPGFQIKSKVT